jgi:hypothetical protein
MHIAQRAAGALQKDLSGSGQLYRSRGSHKKRVPQNLLELPNLLRQRWLRQVQANRCSPEMQLLGDGDKVAQVAKFKVAIHSLKIIILTNKILDVSLPWA